MSAKKFAVNERAQIRGSILFTTPDAGTRHAPGRHVQAFIHPKEYGAAPRQSILAASRSSRTRGDDSTPTSEMMTKGTGGN